MITRDRLGRFARKGAGAKTLGRLKEYNSSQLTKDTVKKSEKMRSGRLAEHMDNQSSGHVDVQAIKRKLAEGGDLYVKVQWPISKLDKSSFTKHSDRVDPKLASSTKGAIIVGAKGEIVDGRHRTLASMNSGKKYIEAWVPITDAMSHAK